MQERPRASRKDSTLGLGLSLPRQAKKAMDTGEFHSINRNSRAAGGMISCGASIN